MKLWLAPKCPDGEPNQVAAKKEENTKIDAKEYGKKKKKIDSKKDIILFISIFRIP